MPKGWKQMTLPTRLLRRFRELKPQKMSDHKFLNVLLDIYLSKSAGLEPATEQEQKSVYDYPECPYRTLLKDGNILCEEKHKIPLRACITRQKRYIAMERKCRPVGRPRPASRRRPRRTASQADKDHYCVLQGIYVSREDLPLPRCLSCPNKSCLDGLRSRV